MSIRKSLSMIATAIHNTSDLLSQVVESDPTLAAVCKEELENLIDQRDKIEQEYLNAA